MKKKETHKTGFWTPKRLMEEGRKRHKGTSSEVNPESWTQLKGSYETNF